MGESVSLKSAWDAYRAARDAGHVVTSIRYLRRITQLEPEDVGAWINLADELSEIARYEEAHKAAREALRLAPPKAIPPFWLVLASIYDKQGRFGLAERWYRKSLEHRASTTTAIHLGSLLARRGAFAEAKKAHRLAIRVGNGAVDEAHFNLGLILRAESRLKLAIEQFDKAIELDPDYEYAKFARDDCLAATKVR